jgi:hypothetical protein
MLDGIRDLIYMTGTGIVSVRVLPNGATFDMYPGRPVKFAYEDVISGVEFTSTKTETVQFEYGECADSGMKWTGANPSPSPIATFPIAINDLKADYDVESLLEGWIIATSGLSFANRNVKLTFYNWDTSDGPIGFYWGGVSSSPALRLTPGQYGPAIWTRMPAVATPNRIKSIVNLAETTLYHFSMIVEVY